ncbi:MAG TPA: ParB/RepB/Spo0J family partition protein [Candidatus Binataceae bacterium]|nr:ParB/RepB/Spo0J family partition protein [Candidatus Binataceae bacterium]
MMRKPLGRGLDALIENTLPEAETAQVLFVPIDEIAPCPWQPRTHFDQERLSELAAAIRSQGIIEPLIVRFYNSTDPGHEQYELIAGERRLRAARLAGLEKVPALLRDLDNRGALEMALVENLAREDLNAVEEGRALARLHKEFGQSHDDIAARIGKSRPYVSNSIRLLELPEAVLEMVEQGKLTAGQARPLLTLGSADAQVTAARAIVDRGITARGAEAIASEHRRKRNGAAPRRVEDPNLNALAEGLQRALKRKVRIVKRRGKHPGRIELDYYDDNDLTALASMLTGQRPGAAAHV